jgi:thioesterase domain-containing protein/NAD(P)-dependent dehydrogenase (short-subunit alcohol dehydrogenase family)/aryl carrier-like protein
LVDTLVDSGALPGTIVHATAVGSSRRQRRPFGADDGLAAYDAIVERDHASLLLLAMALSAHAEPVRLAVVTSGVHALDSTDPLLPERALLHGAARVIPRELGHVETVAIDVDRLTGRSPALAGLVADIGRELDAEWTTDLVVLRRGERWIRTFEPVVLPPAEESPWRDGGVHVITGGLGGIGLSVAEQIALRSRRPTLVLVGRTPLPATPALAVDPAARHRVEAVQRLRDLGATVVVETADVTDEVAMEALARRVRRDHGHVTTVIHAAGILHDALIALRTPVAQSAVVDVKAKGVLVLGKVFAKDPPDLLVLFSSVSSIIGLPGQVDYTAANAYLDAYAAKANRNGTTRAIAVNWNAWQDVGMAVDAARVERDQAPLVAVEPAANPTLLFESADEGDVATFSTGFSRRRHWLVGEHVVRDGEALIPGTGFLELIRGAAAHGQPQRPLELTDVFFMSPFVVGDGEVRTLTLKLDRSSGSATVFSDTETAPHATATVGLAGSEPAPQHDLEALRARCTERIERFDGYSDQPFMVFGPRWGSLRSVAYGDGEALVTAVMPAEFTDELADLWLHPALLDVVTGSAQALIPDFAPAGMFYVPFSYGRVISRGPLPAVAFSHVVLRSASANDLAVFDISIMDEHGNEVVAVESFTMRRVAGGTALTALRRTEVPMAAPSGVESTVGAAIRYGIEPAEGVDAFDRIVASALTTQVIASSVDVERWQAKVDAEASSVDDETESGGPQYARPDIGSEYAPPATPIERELAGMWRELLGVERVGRDDDFFELGGQSLIAVRLFTRMKRRYSIDLPLATLFEAPTIAQCAQIVAAKLGVVDSDDAADQDDLTPVGSVPVVAAEPGFRPLVTIQRGSDDLIPFFCVHGAGGNVLNFRDLSRAMGRSQPFYGVQAYGVDGIERPLPTIEEMAAAYLTHIRALQPEGPYLLGGYSGGGIVAFEMARQITAAGGTVGLVVMFDTFPPQVPDRDMTLRLRARRLLKEGWPYVQNIVVRRLRERRTARDQARIDAIVQAGGVVPTELRETHIERTFAAAAQRYVLRPWSGHVVLMRATKQHFTFRALGEAYGWDTVVQDGFELVKVPGDHDTLVVEPNATTLVRQLRATLDRTQAASRFDRQAG